MSFISEFKEFIMRGNVADLAVAVVIGAAFTSVVNGLVADIITPLIGVAWHSNFSSITYTINGSTFQIGLLINALISFLIVALVVFFLIVKPIRKLQERTKKAQSAEPTTKVCPQCLSIIPIKARKCAFCTSKVK